MSSQTPRVSIVVPVYNAQKYLDQCARSLLDQTYGDFELIFVDDGSTDSSLALLNGFASADRRVRVLSQPNAGCAHARNTGMAVARGEFMFFMDADDYCDLTMLEKAVARADEFDADVVVTAFAVHSELTGHTARPSWDCDWRHYPIRRAFTWRDHPDHLFSAFHNYVWNKLVRTSLLQQNGIMFPRVRLTEDLMFSAPILVLAKRIAYVNEPLVFHRDGAGTNIMSFKHQYPFDFIEAFHDLKVFLEQQGVYGELYRAYVNWAAGSCQYNLMTIGEPQAFLAVYDALQRTGLDQLGLADAPPEVWNERYSYEFVQRVLSSSPQEMLHHYYMESRGWNEQATYRLQAAWHENDELKERVAELEKANAALGEQLALRDDAQARPRSGGLLDRVRKAVSSWGAKRADVGPAVVEEAPAKE